MIKRDGPYAIQTTRRYLTSTYKLYSKFRGELALCSEHRDKLAAAYAHLPSDSQIVGITPKLL